MVCWIKRVKRLGIVVPQDERFEKELMRELNVKSHEELEINLKILHDETFEAIVESILRRRKKISVKNRTRIADIYI